MGNSIGNKAPSGTSICLGSRLPSGVGSELTFWGSRLAPASIWALPRASSSICSRRHDDSTSPDHDDDKQQQLERHDGQLLVVDLDGDLSGRRRFGRRRRCAHERADDQRLGRRRRQRVAGRPSRASARGPHRRRCTCRVTRAWTRAWTTQTSFTAQLQVHDDIRFERRRPNMARPTYSPTTRRRRRTATSRRAHTRAAGGNSARQPAGPS